MATKISAKHIVNLARDVAWLACWRHLPTTVRVLAALHGEGI